MICTVCGWIYTPEMGDPDNNVAPNTKWEDIPDKWTCPECAAPKSAFKPVS